MYIMGETNAYLQGNIQQKSCLRMTYPLARNSEMEFSIRNREIETKIYLGLRELNLPKAALPSTIPESAIQPFYMSSSTFLE